MTRHRSKSRPRRQGRAAVREWIGGLFPAPAYITGEEMPYRPTLAAWIEAPDGLVVGFDLSGSGDEPGALARALDQAMRQPLVGPVRRPSSIRVADPDLVSEVKAVVGETIRVTVAPTPELDEMADLMFGQMAVRPSSEDDDGGRLWSYLGAGNGRISPGAVADLFAAAGLLRHVAPWDAAGDQQILRLDIPELGVDGACVSIIGALGDSLGLLIFPSLAGFEAFLEAASGPIDPMSRMDLGTSWLSFTLVPADELPTSMRREVAEHGWSVKDELSYPLLEHRDRDGVPRPPTEREVNIASLSATALTAFFVNNRSAFEIDDPEPVCQSYSHDNGPTVRFTLPYEALPMFDISGTPPLLEAARTRPPGRNDPCSCGSGKKYKKCHLRKDRGRARIESRLDELHQMDQELVFGMCQFAAEYFGEEWSRSRRVLTNPMRASQISTPWSVHHLEVRGWTIREWFRRERSKQLSAEEKAWLSAQDQTWLSVWEVLDFLPGESLSLEDQLTGDVRMVQDRLASTTVARRDSLLGRVTPFGELALLCGVHPRPLPPREAAEVVRRTRSRLRRKGAVPTDRLKDEKTTLYLIRRWEEAAAKLDRRHKTPPQLRNTDDDPLLMTVDHYELESADRHEIGSRLASLRGVQSSGTEDDGLAYVFVLARGGVVRSREGTVVGVARLSGSKLHLETNSRRRADNLRRRVERVCGSLIRHRAREHPNLRDAGRPVTPDKASSPELRQLELQFKEQHYADWPDQPLPALGGLTPREASRTKGGREQLDILLKEMENLEERAPAESRFEFSKLRRELRLKP